MTIIQKGELMGDLISRQAAVELIERMKPYHQDADDIAEMIANMPSAQPECEDAVSRFEVLRLIDYSSHDLNDAVDNRYMQNEIKQLPSVTPKQPGWIPVTERLPEEPYGCLVTVWDTNPVTMDEFENVLPYFVGWDGEQWNNEDGERCPFEVIAWMPLPTTYREGGQDE